MPTFKAMLGYVKSLFQLRRTRLGVESQARLLESQGRQIAKLAKREVASANSQSLTPYYLLEIESASLLSALRDVQFADSFDARAYVDSFPEFRGLYTNGEPKDLDGGFHENLKTALRTSEIDRKLDLSQMSGVVVLVQRLRQGEYWKALYYARYHQKDILFAETTFFGAFAGYFVNEAPSLFRKCFGYVLDDRSYYFDCRVPSRMEEFLNSDAAVLSPAQQERSDQLIERIIRQGITKYNFSLAPRRRQKIAKRSVLVIEQKYGDASIEFGGALPATFEHMTASAIAENPDATIYLKGHPDNAGEGDGVLDDRVVLLGDDVDLPHLLDQVEKVYVVSSQVGFEAILRGKQVEVFGMPFYAGWGLTNDRQAMPRRKKKRTRQELFHAACIRHSVYVNPDIGGLVEIEEAFDWMQEKLQQYRSEKTKFFR